MAEGDRVAFARRLLGGDLDAIEEAASSSLGDLDFPFETEAEVAAADAQALFLHLDLPEIEDVIPEVAQKVLKDGTVKEMKRKKDERAQAYATLVTGLGFMMAAAALATAPSATIVNVAAYAQRKQRRTSEIGDEYVYEVAIPRSAFAGFDVSSVDPVQSVSDLGGRIESKANFELKKLKPPAWAVEFGAGA